MLMNNSNNCEDTEFEYYSSIIEFFRNPNPNKEAIEIWKDKSFIDLMRVLERSTKKEFVQNSILLILSLFEKNPLDIYASRGTNVNSIGNGEKKSYISILKSEFIDELPN